MHAHTQCKYYVEVIRTDMHASVFVSALHTHSLTQLSLCVKQAAGWTEWLDCVSVTVSSKTAAAS